MGKFPREARNTYHAQARGGKGKFSSEFFHWCIFQALFNPITLVYVSLERSLPAPQFEHKCCLS